MAKQTLRAWFRAQSAPPSPAPPELTALLEAGADVGWIARQVGVQPQTVRSWQEGATAPSPKKREALAGLMGAPLEAYKAELARIMGLMQRSRP
jgi:DNA-binding transcriptional regulator YiaG